MSTSIDPSPAYPRVGLAALQRVLDTQMPALEAAADILTETIARGDVVQLFGTGHSRAVTLEFCGRAGGLAPVGMLAVKDLVMFGGEAPESILDPTFERESGIARRILDLAAPHPGDAFVLVSNSGINAAVVEMAQIVRSEGHPLIAITSLSHTRDVPSRDSSGLRLADLADVVIDNQAPVGDAAVELDDGSRVGGLSNLVGIFIAQTLVELIGRRLLARGSSVPVFTSANVPEGDARNEHLVARTAGRVRPIEP